MRWVAGSDGVRIAVHEVGDRRGVPLVVAHGVGSSSWFVEEAFAVPVLTAGFRLIAYDLRGHGASDPVTDPRSHGFEAQLEDLHAVVTASGARIVAGVSLGGHVAVGYAARGGAVDAVVACLPAWTGRAIPGEGPHAAIACEARTVGVAGILRRVETDPTVAPWLRALLLRDWSRHDGASLEAALVALDGGLAPTEAELRRLPVPLGVVGWPDDPGHPLEVARCWAAWAPRAVLEEITMSAVGRDGTVLGAAAITALRRLRDPAAPTAC